MGSERSVLVVGAGVVGLACALHLQRRGHRVVISDPDERLIAPSWGNAGHIATEQVEPLANPVLRRTFWKRLFAFDGPLDVRAPWALAPWLWRWLRASSAHRARAGRAALRPLLARALPAWRELAATLGSDDIVRGDGHWVCWENRTTARRGRRHWHGADTGSARWRELDAGHLDRLHEHGITGPQAGIRFDGTGQIADPTALAQQLQTCFIAQGGQRRFRRVHALQRAGDRVGARYDDGSLSSEDVVLVCAGIGSAQLFASLGAPVPLVAERGYHLQWREHAWPDDVPPVVFEDRSIIVTRFRSGLRVAGFVELAPRDAPPDPRKWHALQKHVEDLRLPVRGEPALWFGARPTLPDYLPAIGRARDASNLVYAFGHQHLGLTLAAVTGELIGALVDGEATEIPVAPFDVARFES